MSTVLSGVLRGAGRQRLGAVIMAAVAWGFGLPLQTALAFTAGWGVAGMWLGAAVSSSVQAVVEVDPDLPHERNSQKLYRRGQPHSAEVCVQQIN